MFQFNIGDEVWHINQIYHDGVICKPFTVKLRIVVCDNEADYVICLGSVHMLASTDQLVKVVK